MVTWHDLSGLSCCLPVGLAQQTLEIFPGQAYQATASVRGAECQQRGMSHRCRPQSRAGLSAALSRLLLVLRRGPDRAPVCCQEALEIGFRDADRATKAMHGKVASGDPATYGPQAHAAALSDAGGGQQG